MLNSKIQSNGGDTVSFIKQVSEAMAARGLILNYLETVAPDGKLNGKEFKFKDGSTRSVNIKTGKGVNFATRSGGAGDVVGVCAYEEKCNQFEAAKRLNARYDLGIDGGGAPLAYGPKAYTRAAGASGVVVHAANRLKNEGEGDDVCTDISEEELAAGVSKWTPYKNWSGFAFVRSWTYRHADGRAAFVVARYDKEGEKKVFHPWCVVGERREWISKHFPKPRPIYNLPALVNNPDAVVVVVEGEKCADAGTSLRLPGVVFTTWGGGSGTAHIKSAEWTPLSGRRVIVWPDLDETGQKAKQTILGILRKVGAAEVFTIEAPEKPAKWDCAEAVAAGEDVPAILAGAVPCEAPASELPALVLRNESGRARITDIAAAIALKLAASGKWFRQPQPNTLNVHARQLVTLEKDDGGQLCCSGVDKARFNSEVEKHFRIVSETLRGNQRAQVQEHLSMDCVSQIIASDAFKALPAVKGIISAPRLTKSGDVAPVGYDAEAQVFSLGAPVDPAVPLEEAVQELNTLLSGFKLRTPADHSRFQAALILPRIRQMLYDARDSFPLMFFRADMEGAGKGTAVDLITAVYREDLQIVAMKGKGGVGGFDEDFCNALGKQRAFIVLDNLKGIVDSQKIESALTAKTFSARGFGFQRDVDMRQFSFFATSNGAEFTRDFARRCLQISILMQKAGHRHKQFDYAGKKLDLLSYAEANQARILGSIDAVIREWIRQGRPEADTTHSMRKPMAIVNWIVQNVLGGVSCDEGHASLSTLSSDPFAGWLREFGLKCRPAEAISASRIIEEAELEGMEMPKQLRGKDEQQQQQELGRKLSRLFEGKDKVELGEFVLHRRQTLTPDKRKSMWLYSFEPVAGMQAEEKALEASTAPADPVCETPIPEELATFKREQFTGCKAPDPAAVRAAFEFHRVNPSDEYERQLCAASLHNIRHGAGADGAEADWDASTVGWSEDRKEQARKFARLRVETVRQSI